jgi:sulfite dehydrogenase (cytochrome) subunit B
MQYQPPTAARPYWDAMVKRMKVVFKAPIDDADMPLIVDYLVKTYGNEQPK